MTTQKFRPFIDTSAAYGPPRELPYHQPTLVALMKRNHPVRQKNLHAIDGAFHVPEEHKDLLKVLY